MAGSQSATSIHTQHQQDDQDVDTSNTADGENVLQRTGGHCLIGGDARHGDGVSGNLVGETSTQGCLTEGGRDGTEGGIRRTEGQFLFLTQNVWDSNLEIDQ